MPNKVVAALMDRLQPVADAQGLYLVDVEFTKEEGMVFLRIFIDHPQGVSAFLCEQFLRSIEDLVEDAEYDQLEVSSSGQHPLKTQADYARLAGKEIEVRLYAPLDGKKIWVGTLLELQGDTIHLRCGEEQKAIERKLAARVLPYFRI